MLDFRVDTRQKPLGNTLSKPGQGVAGVALFDAGIYPACSIHGAMNRVASQQLWRCLMCNIGVEYHYEIHWGTGGGRTDMESFNRSLDG